MQSVKKILSIFLVVFMLLTAVPLSGFVGAEWSAIGFLSDEVSKNASAAEILYSGKCGENLTYTFDSDGLFTVSGTGAMFDQNIAGADSWRYFRSSIKKVFIGEGVTRIGNYVFHYCQSLETVEFANNSQLRLIGENAFSDCDKLSMLTLPGRVMKIDSYAFHDCNILTVVSLPGNLMHIGDYAFSECRVLEDVLFGENSNLQSIGDAAFRECTSLTSFSLPATVKEIGAEAFYYCPELAFFNFAPNSQLEVIGEDAFHSCSSLSTIRFPDSVTTICWGAFDACAALTCIEFGANSKLTSLDSAFYECPALAYITLPDSLIDIQSSFVGTAFYENESNWANGVLYINNHLIDTKDNWNVTTYTVRAGTKAIAASALHSESLTSIFLPDSITSIGENAFYCPSLSSIRLTDNIKYIGRSAFAGCAALTSINIPAAVKSIGAYAFRNCTSLASVTFEENSELISIGSLAFSHCTSLADITLPDSLTDIQCSFDDTAFYKNANNWTNGVLYINNHLIKATDANGTFTVKDGTKSIAVGAFENCKSLKSVILPEGLKGIGEAAFSYCTTLVNINIPQSVIYFGDRAFEGCRGLKNITIPDGVTRIGELTFAYCYYLDNITIPNSVTSIGDSAFSSCNQLKKITLSNKLTIIGKYAFCNCTALESITIPTSVTYISDSAFSGCSSLKEIHYHKYEDDWAFIEIESNNAPIINAAKYFGLTCQFYRANGSKFNFQYNYADKWFAESSSIYNHKLCIASAGLAYHAGTPDYENNTEPKNAIETFRQMEFDTWAHYGYSDKDGNVIEPTFDSIACVIGSKRNVKIGGETKTIVAVAVRGLGYKAEWGGNFNIGKDEHHAGFELAADQVLSNLNRYLTVHQLANDDIIYWVTGYSRAAATANLVAANLTDGGQGYNNIQSTYPNKDTVFGYMFATPNNTTDSKAESSAYSNIFNIINPIDFVPTMAPEAWGFTKYGVCYYLPAKEYSPGYMASGGLYEKMQKSYKSITGNTYKEDFTFYEYDVDVKWTGGLGFDVKAGFVPTNTMGQVTYLNNLTNILATEVLRSRKYCVDNYQSVLQKTAATFLGNWKCKKTSSGSPLELLGDALSANFSDIILKKNGGLISSIIETVLAEKTDYTAKEIDDIADDLSAILVALVKHPNYLKTTFQFAQQKAPNGTQALFATHEFETYMSWLALVGTDGVAEHQVLRSAKSYKNLLINCPVNVNVYDSNGTLVASVVDNNSVNVGTYSLSYYVDENGQKIISLPYGEEYNVEIIATDAGTVNCSVHRIGDDGFTVESVVNFDPINVEKDDVLHCKMDADADGNGGTLTDQNGESVDSSAIAGDEVKEYTVTLASAPEGGVIFGGGTYVAGEFAQASAIETDEYTFLGWYDGEKLVSPDQQYRFAVTENKTLTAHFSYTPATSFILGDVDGDGEVTSSDARSALRAAVGLDVLRETQQKAADADKNGEIEAADARLILRTAVGLETL